jgi:hypothetical protein
LFHSEGVSIKDTGNEKSPRSRDHDGRMGMR